MNYYLLLLLTVLIAISDWFSLTGIAGLFYVNNIFEFHFSIVEWCSESTSRCSETTILRLHSWVFQKLQISLAASANKSQIELATVWLPLQIKHNIRSPILKLKSIKFCLPSKKVALLLWKLEPRSSIEYMNIPTHVSSGSDWDGLLLPWWARKYSATIFTTKICSRGIQKR